jgi:hypothetical protein
MSALYVKVWATFIRRSYIKNCVLHAEFSLPVLFSDLIFEAINGKKHMRLKHHVTKAYLEVVEESSVS